MSCLEVIQETWPRLDRADLLAQIFAALEPNQGGHVEIEVFLAPAGRIWKEEFRRYAETPPGESE